MAEKDFGLKGGINPDKDSVSFQELSLDGRTYFTASRSLNEFDLVSVVAAPKDLLLEDLDDTMKSYLLLLALTVLAALSISLIISRAITRPIDKMIYYIDRISTGEVKSLPPGRYVLRVRKCGGPAKIPGGAGDHQGKHHQPLRQKDRADQG